MVLTHTHVLTNHHKSVVKAILRAVECWSGDASVIFHRNWGNHQRNECGSNQQFDGWMGIEWDIYILYMYIYIYVTNQQDEFRFVWKWDIYIYIPIYPSLLAILIGKMTIDHQILEFSS